MALLGRFSKTLSLPAATGQSRLPVLRAFSGSANHPSRPAYPQVYGTLEETVMSPYKGGPVYLWLRSSIIWARRSPGRHWMRWLDRNWDFQKMCMLGVPEHHIDPTKNRWRYFVDTSYYGGMLDKSHEDFYRFILMYPGLAMLCFAIYCRWKDNDKDNFLAKWRTRMSEPL